MSTVSSQDQGHSSTPADLAASIQVLTLPEGIYAFTVKGGAPATARTEGLTLPALQVARAPASGSGTIEFLTSPGAHDRWLARNGDVVTARISGGSVPLLLTSVRSADSPVLSVDLRRLDVPDAAPTPALASQSASPSPSANGDAGRPVAIRVLAHVRNVGDLEFSESWAGRTGEGLWIEAFVVKAVEPGAAGFIEYCGVTADGFSTPWLNNELLCGSRGRATPLVGFAIRAKPSAAELYDCVYRGKFASGATVGPISDGRLCRSEMPDDPLEGIELRVLQRRSGLAGSAAF